MREDEKVTYLSETISALKDLGGVGTIKQICEQIEKRGLLPYIRTNEKWRNNVNAVITTHSKESKSYVDGYKHLFHSVDGIGKGVWGLIGYTINTINENTTEYDFIECDENYKISTWLYTKEDFLNQVYLTEQDYNSLTSLLKYKKNIILQGSPGVGKTYSAKRLAYAIMGKKDDSRINFVQFHQNYSYENFIMGYRPFEDSFELVEGVFYKFCKRAEKNPDKEYFFIIDEINRGNLSKIFGELLMLIESDKRYSNGYYTTLAYRNEKFSVPDNIYIIGMMNTADHSLAIIDYALRRRFSFFEMKPAFDTESFRKYSSQLNSDIFNALIEQIKLLNKEISRSTSLGKGFCIGHSYFCNLDSKSCTSERIRSIVDYDILPLLYEYWFDDVEIAEKWKKKLYESIGAEYDE